jgi:tRNA U34 2-thiouridine synthase MnmA/TrmU
MNPCIDCRIYMLGVAKRVADELSAGFIITGDVLGERTMSQSRRKLMLEERESGLEGMILRPLSARLLPLTTPERRGLVDRNRLLGIWGQSRKPQIALARELEIEGFRFPDGGCLLTCIEFASKIESLFNCKETVTIRDINLLKIGRHFHVDSTKVIVGRNEKDNRLLLEMKNPGDWVFEVPGCGSPITILENPCDNGAIELAARLTARYSDADDGSVLVDYRRGEERRTITVETTAPFTFS